MNRNSLPRISRRDFLKSALAALAGLMFAGLWKPLRRMNSRRNSGPSLKEGRHYRTWAG